MHLKCSLGKISFLLKKENKRKEGSYNEEAKKALRANFVKKKSKFTCRQKMIFGFLHVL